MRPTLLASVLLSSLLAACASAPEQSPSKHVSQSGALKVHPGLLGMPVPDELQDKRGIVAARVDNAGTPGVDHEGLRTQRSVYFDYNSSSVKAEFNPALQAHARFLAANPKSRMRIEGNADERGPQGYNNALGLKRADHVRQSIVEFGASEKQVVVKSLGERKPKLTGHDEESWAENRRADIIYEREE